MAFPTTGILDDFNRADSADLGTNWSADQFTEGKPEAEISASQAAPAGADSDSWWNIATYGPDCEVYLTLADASSREHSLALRLQNPGVADSCDGYKLYHFTDNNYFVYRHDNDVGTQLGAAILQIVDTDDRTGFEAVGSTLTVYFSDEGGAFSSVGTRTDATYGAAGYLGFGTGANTINRQDNFGGGTIGAIRVPIPRVVSSGARW